MAISKLQAEQDKWLIDKINWFYSENPDEMLTTEDIVTKFGGSESSVTRVVNQMARQGFVRVVRMVMRGE